MNDKKSFLLIGNGGNGGGGSQVQADWNQSDNTQPDYIKNKPTVYNEWFGTQAEYDLIDPKDPNVIYHIEGSETVDWDDVENKPTFASVATSGDYTDLSNTPTIPTVNDATITLTQGGATKGSFTLNQGSNATIALDAGGGVQTLRGLHQTSNDHSDDTINCSIDETSVLEFKFVYYESTGWYYIGNCDNFENCFRVFAYNGNEIIVDCGDSAYGGGRRSYSADFSNRTGHIISVTMSNTYNKWYDETAGETILEANDTIYDNSFSLSDLYLRGDVEWTLITAKLTTQNSVEFDLSVDANGLYDAVADDYITVGQNWEIVIVEGGVDWNDVKNKPNFATVATTGSYNDLNDKPTIPTVPPMTTETLTFTLANNTTVTIEVYVKPQPVYNYFYVEDASGNGSTLSITQADGQLANQFEVFKSSDQVNWTSMGTTNPSTPLTASVPANGKVYLKATNNGWGDNTGHRNQLDCSDLFNIGGNLMSLVAGDNYEGATLDTNYTHQFYWMMNQTNVVDASNLVLPSNVTAGCYEGMFWHCASMTKAPALPAQTLADRCYYWMFDTCQSLDGLTVYADDNSASDCTNNWLYDAAITADFYNLGQATYTLNDPSGVPTGWTYHTSL